MKSHIECSLRVTEEMGAGSPRKPQRDSGKPFQASYVHSCTGSPPHLGFFCTQHQKIVKEAYVGNEENR